MRLNKYINESEFHTTEKWNELKDFLNKKCKPYIKELKGAKYLLLRGVKSSNVPQFMAIKSIRKNRKPRVISSDLHDKLGKTSKELFGWNIRTEGLFTTKSIFDVDQWGNPVIIFPIGNFKYVWNDDVDDLYGYYDNWGGFDGDVFDRYIKPEISQYKTTNLNKYLTKQENAVSECIINGNEYVSINVEWYKTLLKYYT